MNTIKIFLLSIVFIGKGLFGAANPLSGLKEVTQAFLPPEPKDLFLGVVDEKKQLLAALKQEKQKLDKKTESFNDSIAKQLNELSKAVTGVQNSLVSVQETGPLKMQLADLNEEQQVLKETKEARDKMVAAIDETIVLLERYLEDPNFEQFKKKEMGPDQTFYLFKDLQKINQHTLDQEKTVASLIEQENSAQLELQNRKRSAQATIDMYKKKVVELEGLDKTIEEARSSGSLDFDPQQKSDQLLLEEQLYRAKQQFDELRIQEIEHKITLIKTKIFIARSQLEILKKELRRIKPLVRIREEHLEKARSDLAAKRQEIFTIKEGYRENLDKVSVSLEKALKELEVLAKRNNIVLDKELEEWVIEPKESASGYVALYEVINLHEYCLGLKGKKSLLEARIAYENEKLSQETVLVEVKETFHKKITRKFLVEEEMIKEIKKYEALKAENNANLSLFKEKKSALEAFIDTKRRVLGRIKEQKEELQQQKLVLFKTNSKEFARCVELLNLAQANVNAQIDELNKRSGVYADSMVMVATTVQYINFILSELGSVTIWHRPKHAISWDGVKAFMPDIERFFIDIKQYFVQFDMGSFIAMIRSSLHETDSAAPLFFIVLVWLMAVILLYRYIPVVTALLLMTRYTSSAAYTASLLAVCCLTFLAKSLFTIALWVLLYGIIHLYTFSDHHVYIIFYLFSIPYLLYISHRFIRFFVNFNGRHDNLFVSREFKGRLIPVLSVLIYATIIILFFREAFILAGDRKSELPAILLAIHFIIFQLSLIFLISKEQILSLLEGKNRVSESVYEYVDHYYYLIMLAVTLLIIMSNPYVGYGKLVSYIVSGFVGTAVLGLGLWLLYKLFKKYSLQLFFVTDEEFVQERFSYAKSWYGIFIIFNFLLFIFVGFIVGAKIWGWSITLQEMSDWFNAPLMLKGTESPISLFSITQIILFILGGFLLAFAIEQFIFNRIFDLLLIDAGVQNTVLRFSRYLILITAIILGFQNVGLGSLVTYLIYALIISIGWVIKDPVADFFAYFIILVQRQIKIGDYIRIGNDISGVVRKITPRSVVLRRKNSVTIVVPNNFVVSHSLINWNYQQGFIAFEDIKLIVSFSSDPKQVKRLCYEVLDEHPNVLKTPKPVIRLDNFGEYGFEFMVRAFISSNYTLEQWNIASDIRVALIEKFADNDVRLALPTRMLISKAEEGVVLKTGSSKRTKIEPDVAQNGQDETVD